MPWASRLQQGLQMCRPCCKFFFILEPVPGQFQNCWNRNRAYRPRTDFDSKLQPSQWAGPGFDPSWNQPVAMSTKIDHVITLPNFWNLESILFALDPILEPTLFFRSDSRVYPKTCFLFVPVFRFHKQLEQEATVRCPIRLQILRKHVRKQLRNPPNLCWNSKHM